MRKLQAPPSVISIVGPPLAAVGGAFCLYLLSAEALEFLTAWIVLSFPVGMLVGHCALSENNRA